MKRKKLFFRFLFCAEILLFAYVYMFGTRGLHMVHQMKHENDILAKEVEAFEYKMLALEQKIEQWKSHPFYKEKIAREHLQMARKDEKIYYIDE